MCSAARGAVRNAKQKKAVPAKNSEATFLAAPVHMAPPGRQKSEREFCLFGGVFCVRCAAPPAGAAVFAKLAAVVVAFAPGFLIHSAAVSFSAGAVCAGNLIPLFGLPRRGCRGVPQSRRLCPGPRVASAFVSGPRAACLFCVWPALPGLFAENALCAFLHAFFSYHFALSCLTSFSQTSFHLSLRPRRASTFFRKESRQRFARGAAPSNPHSCALRLFFPSSALLAGLVRPFGPQTAG